MEAFMDWWLIYRDEKALESLVERLPAGMFSEPRIFREQENQIVFWRWYAHSSSVERSCSACDTGVP
jgi:hypothetical protein